MTRSRPISLIAAFYRNETEAGEMLAQLKTMDKDGTVDIIDAAVMVKAEDGRKLKITETAELTAKKGGVLGIIFPPSILPRPPSAPPWVTSPTRGLTITSLRRSARAFRLGAPASSQWWIKRGSASF